MSKDEQADAGQWQSRNGAVALTIWKVPVPMKGSSSPIICDPWRHG